MIILPAIDLKDGKCVRLFQGDYATAEQVAEDPVKTAQSFEEQGARWVHLVDLDGAKARRPVNDSTVFSIRDNVSMNIEVGGGIRDMDTVGILSFARASIASFWALRRCTARSSCARP